ncbi:hypothetical protein [Micromonospora rifamycinica]|nr:hypothetical protein [Micromonospora rifamycinica]
MVPGQGGGVGDQVEHARQLRQKTSASNSMASATNVTVSMVWKVQ